MTTAYTPILKLALPVTGELNGTWGDVVNNNITSMVEQAVAGLATINTWTANSHTLTTADGTTSESRCAMLVIDDDGAGNPSAAATVICPAATKAYIVQNLCGQTVTVKTAAGTGIAVPNNQSALVFCDGTNVVTGAFNGDVVGPASATNNAIVRYDGTTGKLIQDSGVTIDDDGNIIVGGSAGFTSTINDGAAAVTGIGIFPFTLSNGTTNADVYGTIVAQNNTEFVGTNGASSQTYSAVSSTPAISNSGAAGSGSTTSHSFLAWPTIQSSGSSARLTQVCSYNVSRRENANDTSTNSNNSIWGGAFFVGHESTLPNTASTRNVYGTYVIAANKSGITTDIRAHDATVQVGLTSINASATTAAGFYLNSFAVGSASANTATVTSGFGLRLAGPTVSATGTITDYYAVFAGAKTGTGSITNNWALYLSDTAAKSFIGGTVGIGTTTPNASAILDVQSTAKGVRMPNMTTVQKNAIASPAAGLMVFDTTLSKLCVYTGAAWETITSA